MLFYVPVVLNTTPLNLSSENIPSVIYQKIAHWTEHGYLQFSFLFITTVAPHSRYSNWEDQ